MTGARKLSVAVLVTTLFVVCPAVTAAQPDAQDTALARTLFEEGLALVGEQRWDDAADRFRRAMELRDAPAIRFNLGQTLGQLGRLVEASEMLRTVEGHADANEELREQARAERGRVEARFSHLIIHLEGATDDVVVELDGEPMSEAALGVRVPVDPGEHRVDAMRGGAVVVERSTSVDEGEVAELTLSVTPREVPRPTNEEVVVEEGGSILGKWWFWTLVGALVVAGVVVGVALGTSGGRAPTQGDLVFTFD